MSVRTIGRTMGALFLLAFVVYIAGGALVDSPDDTRRGAGALLMLVNSGVVVALGVLAFPVLKPHDEITAHAYLIGRTVEAVMLAVGIVFLLLHGPAQKHDMSEIMKQGNHFSYQIAMISLGVAGLLFCRVLLRARLVPRFLAVWGLIGYAIFLLGAVLEILGYPVGTTLAVPGGLFEIALGILLIAKGFAVVGQDGLKTAVGA